MAVRWSLTGWFCLAGSTLLATQLAMFLNMRKKLYFKHNLVGPNSEAGGRAWHGLHIVAASRLRLGRKGGAENISGAQAEAGEACEEVDRGRRARSPYTLFRLSGKNPKKISGPTRYLQQKGGPEFL